MEECSDIIIRRGLRSDIQTIAEFNQAMAWETEALDLELDRLITGVSAVMDDENKGFYLVVECRGEIGACLMVTREWSDWRNSWWWWIQSLYVQENFRRHHLFSRMYDRIREMAAKDAAAGIRLYVDQHNRGARTVYDKCGMEESNYVFYEQAFDQV